MARPPFPHPPHLGPGLLVRSQQSGLDSLHLSRKSAVSTGPSCYLINVGMGALIVTDSTS